MRYIDVEWIHDFQDEPVRLISEIDHENYELRKLEIYRDGSVGFATDSIEHGGSRLGVSEIPPVEEINSDPEFKGREVDKHEFDVRWNQFTSGNLESI